MAVLVERNTAFVACPALAAEIKIHQQLSWNEISEDEDISEEDKADIRSGMDDIDVQATHESSTVYHVIANDDTDDYLAVLTQSLSSVFQLMYGNKSIHFAMESRCPWLYQKNKYKRVVAAVDYLKSIGVNESYSDCINIDREEWREMLYATFWLGRCNASLPRIYFSIEASKVCFSICQYGGLHVTFNDKAEQEQLKQLFEKEGFKLTEGSCGSYAIGGRQIIV